MTIEQERKAVRYALAYLNKELRELKRLVRAMESRPEVSGQTLQVKRVIEEMERDVIEFERLVAVYS